ncbi:hypothetical protein BJV74DRAFT_851244 [Russula compacta]|nr:hypothetical protein BJV74DRAFT_851244 [Russula compacta]
MRWRRCGAWNVFGSTKLVISFVGGVITKHSRMVKSLFMALASFCKLGTGIRRRILRTRSRCSSASSIPSSSSVVTSSSSSK